ncbi:hypothetical protein B0H17DRAFT_1144833 [Mycena rosella]|uniref:Uncharacterized protein n=1 Tax=Mycena rosella TaxID=1033263 RepID=A0AAD7G597_MYCRO|nr:hypothetical protein B0H17DRAFT_1144833 [Mycena rosella]
MSTHHVEWLKKLDHWGLHLWPKLVVKEGMKNRGHRLGVLEGRLATSEKRGLATVNSGVEKTVCEGSKIYRMRLTGAKKYSQAQAQAQAPSDPGPTSRLGSGRGFSQAQACPDPTQARDFKRDPTRTSLGLSATVRRAVFTVMGPSVEAPAAFTYGSAAVRVDPYTGYPYPSVYGSTGPTGQRGYGDTINARKARFRRGGRKSGGSSCGSRHHTGFESAI